MERFDVCWEDRDVPYLQPLADTPDHDPSRTAFCNTRDKAILSQVLNNYDQETVDFYRWAVTYGRDEISRLIADRSGIDVGRVSSLEPLERGESGRIWKLKIIGEEGVIVVGKELDIRRLLSDSHLKSSAFEVKYLDSEGHEVSSASEWAGVRLEGSGWGHGVGLCQIGAAVMASKGYDYRQILAHYYPGANLNAYEN